MMKISEQMLTYITWLRFSAWNFLHLFTDRFPYASQKAGMLLLLLNQLAKLTAAA